MNIRQKLYLSAKVLIAIYLITLNVLVISEGEYFEKTLKLLSNSADLIARLYYEHLVAS